MKNLQKLPIGIQTFQKIRKEDYLYIDKTKEAYELINSYQTVFLSRPRRFGKSLFMDTLQDIFEGNKEYFEDLYIYDKWDWSKSYPVIKIDWNGKLQTIDDLENHILTIFKNNQNRLGIVCDNITNVGSCFNDLIIKSYEKYNMPVVVLIDEYDKPILDVIEDKEQAKLHREFIKGLYATLKGLDKYLKFVMLTGVSKFAKASVFSGLNMLTDISLDKKYGNICGYTQENIETEFKDYFINADLKEVKRWYNGYNFLKDPVYNPFDILLFISKDFKFDNYWWESGSPSFLIALLKKQNSYNIPDLENLIIGKELLNSFDIEKLSLEVILYQAGYLSIDKVIQKRNRIEYKLKVPNQEVQTSLNMLFINYLTDTIKYHIQDDIYDTLESANLEEFKNTMSALFASIPYNNYVNNTIGLYEGYYASVFYTYLAASGLDIIAEDTTNLGRIDLTIKLDNNIYIIEFKVDGTDSLNQIKQKDYASKYKSKDKNIYLIGIEFSSKDKNISNFEYEQHK